MDTHASHLAFWLATLAIAGTVYTCGLILYRVFFHPLAKYPGPFLAKISDLHALYHAWKGDRHIEFWRLHEKYGSVVRFGPNNLSFNTNSALKDIYGFRSNVRKAEFYDAFVHPAANTHNTRDKVVHARKRRVMSQAFSDNAIKEMEKYILGNIRTFCEKINQRTALDEKKKWSLPLNMSDWCSYLAMDILGDLCFGKAFHMLEQPDNRYAIKLVEFAAQRHLICGTMLTVHKLGLDKIFLRKIVAGRSRYVAYSRSQLVERTKLGEDTDRRDFFYHLLNARDPQTGAGFTMSELWGESNLLIIAGSDTTSTAMAATLFYLVRNESALARVSSEVRSIFSSVEDILQGSLLTSCTYLRACIDEAMRLSPSVGGLLPREVLHGGIHVDDHELPAGTVVGVPHYAIQHNPSYYPEPFSYQPERWISGSLISHRPSAGKESGTITVTDDMVAQAQSAFCPFSIGPRGCVGKGLAYVEMTTALARMIFLYDIRRAPDVRDPGEGNPKAEWGRHRRNEYQLRDIFTSIKNGPMIEVRPR